MTENETVEETTPRRPNGDDDCYWAWLAEQDK